MSLITNKNIDNLPSDTSGQVGNVKPVDRIDPAHSQSFSDLIDNKEKNVVAKNATESEEMSLEELQKQVRENLFKSGFNNAMEKAKEINKELKS